MSAGPPSQKNPLGQGDPAISEVPCESSHKCFSYTKYYVTHLFHNARTHDRETHTNAPACNSFQAQYLCTLREQPALLGRKSQQDTMRPQPSRLQSGRSVLVLPHMPACLLCRPNRKIPRGTARLPYGRCLLGRSCLLRLPRKEVLGQPRRCRRILEGKSRLQRYLRDRMSLFISRHMSRIESCIQI